MVLFSWTRIINFIWYSSISSYWQSSLVPDQKNRQSYHVLHGGPRCSSRSIWKSRIRSAFYSGVCFLVLILINIDLIKIYSVWFSVSVGLTLLRWRFCKCTGIPSQSWPVHTWNEFVEKECPKENTLVGCELWLTIFTLQIYVSWQRFDFFDNT